jgi:hypothetical protein
LTPYDRSPVKFVLGSTHWSTTAVIDVASFKMHPDYTKGYADIGIVTLASDAPVTPMKVLPSMDASWASASLQFVGFGHDDGVAKTGKGIKRVATIPITHVFDTYFDYYSADKNTCLHDSGGPAFAVTGGETYVAGITSYGDADCNEFGVDMRPDAFQDFIAANTVGGTSTGTGGTTASSCGSETYAGRCDGNNVVWCDESSQVQQTDCSAQGKTCNYSTEKQYFACIDDPCGGLSYQGTCDGNVVRWCDGGSPKAIDCSAEGKTCTWDAPNSFYDCE